MAKLKEKDEPRVVVTERVVEDPERLRAVLDILHRMLDRRGRSERG